MGDTTLPLLFAFSALGILYVYVGYPLVILALARWFSRPVAKRPMPASLSIVLAGHNEQHTLPKKIANLLACHGSEQIREILVGSDGSTDQTVEILRQHPDPRVKVLDFPQRRGKPAVLNDLVPLATGEILVFADARQEFAPDVLQALAANFADRNVGVVSGELVFRQSSDSSVAAEGIGFYWRYEKLIRKSESQFQSVPGATGACYAMRRKLFQPIPANTLLDDVAIPMQAIMQGYRCIFEPQAIAYDTPSKSTRQESVRKRRTIAGVAQLVWQQPAWLLPWKNPIWFEYVSHKLLRLVSPLLLLVALITNLLLLGSFWFQLALLLQALFYSAAGLGWMLQSRGKSSRLFGPCVMFLSLNITTAFALYDAACSRYRVTWQKAAG